jgi:hypothetical protein
VDSDETTGPATEAKGRSRSRAFDWIALGGLILAIYSAVVATTVAIHDLKADQKRFVISAMPTVYARCPSVTTLDVTIVNTGHRPLTITAIGFRGVKSHSMTGFPQAVRTVRHRRYVLDDRSSSAGLPRRLGDGDTLTVTYDLRRLAADPEHFVFVDGVDAEGEVVTASVQRSVAGPLSSALKGFPKELQNCDAVRDPATGRYPLP